MVHEDKIMDYSKNNTYEKDFSGRLLEFIKNDLLLRPFYERFILECENVIKVIEKLEKVEEEINDSMQMLQKNIERFVKVKKIKELVSLDFEFHEQLFKITDNKILFEMCKQENSLGLTYKTWQSICRNFTHRDRLCKIHFEILEAIKDKDKNKAISTMQEHFAILLIHYVQLVRPSKKNSH